MCRHNRTHSDFGNNWRLLCFCLCLCFCLSSYSCFCPRPRPHPCFPGTNCRNNRTTTRILHCRPQIARFCWVCLVTWTEMVAMVVVVEVVKVVRHLFVYLPESINYTCDCFYDHNKDTRPLFFHPSFLLHLAGRLSY